MQRPPEVDSAYKEFFGSLPFSELKPEWEELFLEWLIFDYKASTGTLFLIEYVLRNPDNLNKDTINQFEQIAKTQFYSQFEILEIKRGQWLKLEDLFTGKIYTVYEKKGSETLSEKGVIPGRLAKVDGKWYLVGANSIYFPITYTQRAKKHMREFKPKKFSPQDTFELLKSHEQQPRQPISVPTKKELEEKRKSLKTEYAKIAKKFNAGLSFDGLIKEIYNEDKTNVLDFWKKLEKKGLKFEMFIENAEIFQDIWNYFPHKCLNDLSPIGVYAKLSKKGSK